MTHLTTKTILNILGLGILLLLVPQSASAATINLSPSSGTFPANQPFTVAVIVDENADSFNAAQAKVKLSQNLIATDLVLGNCDFSFVKTPTSQDPSFVGVNLGGEKENCTVYTLTLIPSGLDTASISLSDASVKRHGDAAELITAVQYGNYTLGSANIGNLVSNFFSTTDNEQYITAVANAATIESTTDLEGYTLNVKVLDDNGDPLQNAVVTLQPQLQVADATAQQVTTNSQGVAEFTNIDPSMYTVRAKYNGDVLAEQIINAKGSDPVLTLGLQEEQQSNYFPLIAGLLGIAAALLFLFRSRLHKLLRRADNTSTTQ